MAFAITERALTTPNALALCDDRVQLGWRALDERINRAANALLSAGLRADARVAVFAQNSAEAVIAYVAALRAGISSVPLSFHLTAAELAPLLERAGAGILFVGPETAAVGLKAARISGIRSVIGWRCPDSVTGWEPWLAAASPEAPPCDMPPRRQLHFTSGTTGIPKAAETPPAMFPAAATVGALFTALGEQVASDPAGSPALVAGPLYHSAGMRLTRLHAGGLGLVVMPRFDPEAVLAAIERYSVRTTTLVPTHFQRLLALPPDVRNRYDLSSLRMVMHTGAACLPEVKRAMIAWLGPILLEAYGGTEIGTTNRITSAEWLQRPGSVGRAVPPFELVIRSEDGLPLPPGETGEIWFRDTSGRGIVYHGASAGCDPALFTLGEVGHVDEDGYLFITDRASDMIVSGGVNLYPAETEQVLIQHPDVLDVAVIGVPNAEFGEEMKALIVPRNAASPPSPRALEDFVRSRIASLKCPRSFDFVADLGRNAMGKINKRALRRAYWPDYRTIGG